MSRRQYTTLTFSVTLPVPAGRTQKSVVEDFTNNIHRLQVPDNGGFSTKSCIIKVTDKRTTYL